MGSYSANLQLFEPTPLDPATSGQWGGYLNTDFTLIDSAVAGILPLSVAGNSNVILTSTAGAADQARNQLFALSGILTGNITVFWPMGLNRFFTVVNSTTGAFTLTIAVNNGSGSPAGATLVIPQGSVGAYSDGTNIVQTLTAFSNLTLAGTTTLPGAGQIASSGSVTIAPGSGTVALTINRNAGTSILGNTALILEGGPTNQTVEINDNSTGDVYLANGGGRVGIGGVPSDIVDIITNTNSQERLRITNSSAGTSCIAGLYASTTAGDAAIIQLGPNTTSGSLVTAGGAFFGVSNQLGLVSNSGPITMAAGGATTNQVTLDNSGRFLIGYTASNGSYNLQVNSQIFATNATIATSDARYKENVADLTGALDMVLQLRPKTYSWKARAGEVRDSCGKVVRVAHNFPAGIDIGFRAQDLQAAFADQPWLGSMVKTNARAAILDIDGEIVAPADEFLGLVDAKLIPLLVGAVQELSARLEQLEAA